MIGVPLLSFSVLPPYRVEIFGLSRPVLQERSGSLKVLVYVHELSLSESEADTLSLVVMVEYLNPR